MKSVFVVVLLAGCVAVGYASATEVDTRVADETRSGLILGSIGPDDRLLSNTNHEVEAALYVVQTQEVLIRAVEYSNITSIRVTEVGTSQEPSISILEGGLRSNFVRFLFRSQKGRAYSFNVRIHGTIGC
ncbi:hypothetical protein HF086_014239 [Spodoptera exigua]|uniref:Salivary secreted peptide n=1 Tax=Spodoptera exigua TaxID=7107 RepID=A0A922MH54_SPOEX|nr:hypothetical protein HF086_014239 [Spodoptera exigua]